MTRHRFFVDPGCVSGDKIVFTKDISHQLRNVLRLRPGSKVIAFDGTGTEYVVSLLGEAGELRGTVLEQRANTSEPAVHLSLYLGILKGHKLELALQKGTEVGVSRFLPVVTERSVPHEPSAARRHRFEAIVREAAEQSGRGIVPAVENPRSYADALAAAAGDGPIYLMWENESETYLDSVRPGPRRASLFIGPEGGLTASEVQAAMRAGAVTISLGPRILRAETAAIVAPALLLSRLELPVDTPPERLL